MSPIPRTIPGLVDYSCEVRAVLLAAGAVHLGEHGGLLTDAELVAVERSIIRGDSSEVCAELITEARIELARRRAARAQR